MIRARPRQLLHGNFTQTKTKSEQNGKLLQLQHGQEHIH